MKEENEKEEGKQIFRFTAGFTILFGFVPMLLIGWIVHNQNMLIAGVLYGFITAMFFLSVFLYQKK